MGIFDFKMGNSMMFWAKDGAYDRIYFCGYPVFFPLFLKNRSQFLF